MGKDSSKENTSNCTPNDNPVSSPRTRSRPACRPNISSTPNVATPSLSEHPPLASFPSKSTILAPKGISSKPYDTVPTHKRQRPVVPPNRTSDGSVHKMVSLPPRNRSNVDVRSPREVDSTNVYPTSKERNQSPNSTRVPRTSNVSTNTPSTPMENNYASTSRVSNRRRNIPKLVNWM